MNEAKIIAPTAIPHEVRQWLKVKLVSGFGGYTMTEGEGAWLDGDDEAVIEPVEIYTVALIDVSMATRFDRYGDRLREIAQWLAKEGNQDCVYVRDFGGMVTLEKSTIGQMAAE